MLYLLRKDGSIEKQPLACRAAIDAAGKSLVCYDEQGREVARYARDSVSLFSDKPLPVPNGPDGDGPSVLMLAPLL